MTRLQIARALCNNWKVLTIEGSAMDTHILFQSKGDVIPTWPVGFYITTTISKISPTFKREEWIAIDWLAVLSLIRYNYPRH